MWTWNDINESYLEKMIEKYPSLVKFIQSVGEVNSKAMMAYLTYMMQRIIEMHRILKPTGSFYLHCDWHADAYIRVNILDKVFGMNNFRNEIVWKRLTAVKRQTKDTYTTSNDKIFFYTKSSKFNFNKIFSEYNQDYIKKFYKHQDESGRLYQLSDFTQQGQGEPKYFGEKIGTLEPPKGKHWIWSQERINEGLKNNLIEFSSNKTPRVRRYLDEKDGMPVDTMWQDIHGVQGSSNESIGYPTQKPEALLERIIKASSNEGDVVLDCFCGGGTTIAVAEKLGRKWIGIDQSVQAIKVTEARLDNIGCKKEGSKLPNYNYQLNLGSVYSVKLHKYDYDTLRDSDAFEFEKWIVEQFGGEVNAKQRGDFGIDGKKGAVPIQVKRSDNIGRNVIDNFKSAMARFYGTNFDKRKGDKEIDGYIIAFSFGKGAKEEIARLKNDEGLIIEAVLVEDIVPIAKKPKLEISFEDLGLTEKENTKNNERTIKFTAKTDEKENAEISLFQWDFDFKEENGFKAEVILDKEGAQEKAFKSGSYQIACKAIDVEGLETVEVLKLKINGVVRLV
jgi:DNA modification methylase